MWPFNSTIKSASAQSSNLVITAGTGNVTFGDTVGTAGADYALSNTATVTTLTGGDSGEGGDFSGTFTHAANFGGSGTTVGDVTFQTHRAATYGNGVEGNGITIYSVNEIESSSWGGASYGDSTNDNNLESMMNSIRWTSAANTNAVDSDYDGIVGVKLTGLNSGYVYKLQLLVREACCADRGYDVIFKNASDNEITINDDFSTSGNSLNTDVSQVITYSFEASGSSAIIKLDGSSTSFTDKNPILSGLNPRTACNFKPCRCIGTLTVNASEVTAGSIFTNGALTINNSGSSSITGVIADGENTTATLTKAGAGTLTLSGTNTYTGQTNINAGTLAVTVNDALGSNAAGTVIASGATLDLQNVTYSTTEAITNNGGTLSTSTGTSSYAGTMTLGANSTIDVDGTQLTISTAIGDGSGGYAITKDGNGTLVLSANSTYSGDTIISDGTLTVTGTLADTTDVSVASGAVYDVDATDTIQSLTGAGNVELASITLTPAMPVMMKSQVWLVVPVTH